jgi:hypothetical protein
MANTSGGERLEVVEVVGDDTRRKRGDEVCRSWQRWRCKRRRGELVERGVLNYDIFL